METIQSLRKQGYKIRVTHYRYISKRKVMSLFHIREANLQGKILAFGGQTQLELSSPTGKTVTAIANCLTTDPFNRKIANQICIGRALKALNN